MARNAVFRSSDGLLLEHGFCDFEPRAGCVVREVPDEFPFRPGAARWNGSETETWTPPASAEEVRRAEYETAIAADATIQQLKAMTNAEFDGWWAANVTTAAQAIAVLKRLARVIIRRVL